MSKNETGGRIMADRRASALVKPVAGQSRWCEGLGNTCAQVVGNDSDHCEAGHPNAVHTEITQQSKISGLAPEASPLGIDDLACPNCGHPMGPISPEPPIGTWVRDQYGAVSIRNKDGWAPALSGFYGFGRWEAMWRD